MPDPRPKRKFPFNIFMYVLVGLFAVGLLLFNTVGKTGASNLQIGDCFELPNEGSFSRVKDQSCSGNHGAQVFAIVVGGDTDADVECQIAYVQLPKATVYELPDDQEIQLVLTDENQVKCLIASPSSGLVGSVVG